MMDFLQNAKSYSNPEIMARDFLTMYFRDKGISYPLNPFQMLKDFGILFNLQNFKKLEGVYIPQSGDDDVPLVGININRPITRQRYTAAHELCHHFRDAEKQINCPLSHKDNIEKFADGFAAAVLMPEKELYKQVARRKKGAYIGLNDVLEIADYFGVSFESCAFRIAYKIHALDGDTDANKLRKRIREYAPDKRRQEAGMTYQILYAMLIDTMQENLSYVPTERAQLVFQNDYIYNDSRMEGVDTTLEEAAEIVTDLRLKKQKSQYCREENEAYLSIAGHYVMYQEIFQQPIKEKCSVFDTVILNKELYSCYPCPEGGGNFRQNDTLVLGAKFETVTYTNIVPELLKLNPELTALYENRSMLPLSEYIKGVIRIHHKLTVIHPFSDGNGRTTRAFMNVLLVRGKVCPVYIKVEEKDAYIKALEIADTTGRYDALYEVIFKALLRSYMELTI